MIKAHMIFLLVLLTTLCAIAQPKPERDIPALCRAAREGDAARVAELLAALDTRVNEQDDQGLRPLDIAAARGHEAVVEQLLQDGRVEVNQRPHGISLALLLAAEAGHLAIVEQLMAVPSINCVSLYPGQETLLCSAVRGGSLPVVERVLQNQGVCASINEPGWRGLKPIEWAVKGPFTSLVWTLLKQGAHVPDCSYAGNVLEEAIDAGAADVAELLIENGADPRLLREYSRQRLSAICKLDVSARLGAACIRK